MDLHVYGNPRLHYRLNGCQQAKDDGLQFLSIEEKECILFFEETIDSLDEGFDDTTGLTSRRTTPAEGLRTSSNSALSPVLAANVSPSLMEHDIIDLVHSPGISCTMPDFQNLAVTPEPHYETIPNKDPLESGLPSSSTNSDAHEENSYHRPPGSIPTPVVIASKIAEHQGTGRITPSTLLGRRQSLESKRDTSVLARNPRLPSNITMTRGHQDPSPHSIATAAVDIQERRSQMLANLPAGTHPLEGGEPVCMRGGPTRSVSFKDTAPEKSRMEALSKLGLIGSQTPTANTTSPNSSVYRVSSSASSPNGSASSPNSNPSKGSSSTTSPNSSIYRMTSSASSPNGSANSRNSNLNKGSSSTTSPKSSVYRVSSNASSPNSSPNKVNSSPSSPINSPNKMSFSTQAHMSTHMNTSSNSHDIIISQRKNSNTSVIQSTSSSGYEPKPKSEISSNSFNYYGGKSAMIMPITKDTTAAAPVNQDRRSSIPASAEVKQTDFNSYGGKTIVLNPTHSVKAESVPSLPAHTHGQVETQFNNYGGRSRVINSVVNTDVSEARGHSPTNTATPTTYQGHPTRSRYPSEPNTSDAKPKAPPDPVYQPVVRTRSATLPPPTTPKPQCPTGSLRPRPEPVPSEILTKPAPSFRNQGVTVQFSGKGTTGDARRDALRRLGLLKNTS